MWYICDIVFFFKKESNINLINGQGRRDSTTSRWVCKDYGRVDVVKIGCSFFALAFPHISALGDDNFL